MRSFGIKVKIAVSEIIAIQNIGGGTERLDRYKRSRYKRMQLYCRSTAAALADVAATAADRRTTAAAATNTSDGRRRPAAFHRAAARQFQRATAWIRHAAAAAASPPTARRRRRRLPPAAQAMIIFYSRRFIRFVFDSRSLVCQLLSRAPSNGASGVRPALVLALLLAGLHFFAIHPTLTLDVIRIKYDRARQYSCG